MSVAATLEADMGITRIEQAIDDMECIEDDSDFSCDDIRLAWLANELDSVGRRGGDFDALWNDR
jgi:hypothetical protein